MSGVMVTCHNYASRLSRRLGPVWGQRRWQTLSTQQQSKHQNFKLTGFKFGDGGMWGDDGKRVRGRNDGGKEKSVCVGVVTDGKSKVTVERTKNEECRTEILGCWS